MPAGGILYPHSPEFDRFLQAFVGEDRKGNAVTVLSALARLKLEPWEEARRACRFGGKGRWFATGDAVVAIP